MAGLSSLVTAPLRLYLNCTTPDLRSLPIPHFIPGPGASWMVPPADWSPATIWDLVGAEPVFTPLLTYGPERVSLTDILSARMNDTGPLSPSQMAYFDPCYFTPGCLPRGHNGVAVLPTIQEDGPFFIQEGAWSTSPPVEFCDIGIQTSDDELEYEASFKDAAVQADDDEELEYEASFEDTAVQADDDECGAGYGFL